MASDKQIVYSWECKYIDTVISTIYIKKTKACTAYCKNNCVHQIKHKELVSCSLSLSFDSQTYPFIHRSNSSLYNINWYTLQCCFDSS